MKFEIFADTERVAQRASAYIVAAAQEAVANRGQFLFAVSGGSTPWRMFELLATADVPWAQTRLFQVDERVADDNSPQRNLTELRARLIDRIVIPPNHVHAMPVTAPDLAAGKALYENALAEFVGQPPEFDLIHLGLGSDGHTASLLPGDSVLEATSSVALTGVYQGHRRMTLTYPVLAQARQLLWVIAGSDKQHAFAQLANGDESIPAGRVADERAIVFADASAAKELRAY